MALVHIPDDMVERAANAMINYQVQLARQKIDSFDFDAGRIIEIATKLLKESETAQILIFYSYLDDQIQQLMKLHFQHADSKSSHERLFGISGPLSSFGSRTLLSYHLGWITEKHKIRLDAFRSVRNAFAHRAFKISITDTIVATQLAKLDLDIRAMLSKTMTDGELSGCDPNSLLCKLIALAMGVFRELVVFPVARQMQVSPHHIVGNFEDQPKLIKNMEFAMAEALLVAAGMTPRQA